MKTQASVTIVCDQVEVVEQQPELSLAELCRCAGASAGLVAELVEHGVLSPQPGADWRFDGRSLAIVRRAGRLVRQLGVNAAGAAVAIELLERIEQLERAQRG
jgi:chaperone modulatory protein CbpM